MSSDSNHQEYQDAVAVIGMAVRFPGARDAGAFWRNLREGVESIRFFSDAELQSSGVDPAVLKDPCYVKANACLEDVDLFDEAFFGFTPHDAETTDPQHRLLLECAWEALESSGYGLEEQEGLVGVFAGSGESRYFDGVAGELSTWGGSREFLTTRISYKLNLKGPSVTVQTACSTSLVAVHLACKSLLDGECDMALAGGASIRLPQTRGYLYEEGGIRSPDGHCRAFDARGRGTVGGNGVGIVLLKRLEEALADRDPVRAVILGSAVNNDGADKVGFTAPSVHGQAEVIAEALALAGVEAGSVSYVEAHGTATPLGDPIEIAALTRAFRTSTEDVGFCALGSVKTNVGHLDSAAGVAGLVKTVLALEHRMLPPSLHFERPNPELELSASPFYVNTRLAAWEPASGPRRAGVSSFGMGGTNAHVVLQEAPVVEPRARSARPSLLLLSGRTEEAAAAAAARLANHLRTNPNTDVADVAHTLQVGRRPFRHRRMAVASDAEEAAGALGESRQDLTRLCPVEDPSVVFLFSGQGSQYAGMGRGLYESEPLFRERLDACSDHLRARLGVDLRDVLYRSDGDERLARTSITQPALFVVEYALAELWMAWGVRPEAMIGHSVGEYVAACLAGVFSLEDGVDLVARRGELMERLPSGAMLAISSPAPEVSPFLEPSLSLAAVNAPSRCVVSGPAEAIDELALKLTRKGTVHRRLHTSHAFHSAMMEPILGPFAEHVRSLALRPPAVPLISDVTGDWLDAATATDPDYWARHLRQPVLFADGIRRLAERPARVYLEVGPGRTLSTCVKEILEPPAAARVVTSLRHPQQKSSDVAFLLEALGRLWLEGVSIDWRGVHVNAGRRRLTLPTYPFERKRFWLERPAAGAAAFHVPAVRVPGGGHPQEDGLVEQVIAQQLKLISQQLEMLQGEADV